MEETFRAIACTGFEGLRLRHVAAAAGIDHSTLHHCFATKQHLIEAVVARATEPLYGTIPDASDGGDRLGRHLDTLAAAIERDPDLFVVLAEIDLRAGRDPNVREVINRVEQGWRDGFAELLDHDDACIELVIATVKGVRLYPSAAGGVLTRLARLLAGTPRSCSTATTSPTPAWHPHARFHGAQLVGIGVTATLLGLWLLWRGRTTAPRTALAPGTPTERAEVPGFCPAASSSSCWLSAARGGAVQWDAARLGSRPGAVTDRAY